MTRAQRRYLVLDLGVGAAAVNFSINGALGWLLFREDAVRVFGEWSEPSVAGDLVATSFLLPFFTTLMVTVLARREIRRGRFQADPRPLPGWVPRRVARRAVVLGFATTMLVAAPLLIAFAALGPSELPLRSFLWAKAWFAAALSVPVTPLVGALAMRLDEPGPDEPLTRSS